MITTWQKDCTTYLTHNFHTYRSALSPQIPRQFIEQFTDVGDTVLDPFLGDGTTMVECKLLNRNGVGIDLNPVSTLVTATKVTPLLLDEVEAIEFILESLQLDIDCTYASQCFNLNIPNFHNRNHWFQENVQRELTTILYFLKSIENPKLVNFLKTALSSIIVSVSNQANKNAIPETIANFQTHSMFVSKVRAMLRRIEAFGAVASSANIQLLKQEAGQLDGLADNSIDLVVTSPFSANTYNNQLYHKLRMYWLGYETPLNSYGIERNFTHSVRQCMQEIARVLKPNKYAVLIMDGEFGNNNFAEPMLLMTTLAKNTGLQCLSQSAATKYKVLLFKNLKDSSTTAIN